MSKYEVFGKVSEYSNSILICHDDKCVYEINKDNKNENLRDELLRVDTYVEYAFREVKGKDKYTTCFAYKIIDRVIDEKNNLILFCDLEYLTP